MSVIIAFDFGLKRTGVAVGNTLTGSATPECTLISKDERPDWEGITRLIEEWKPEQLVVGLPIELDTGPEIKENPIKKRIERFCNQLQGRYNLKVDQENEQFTSIEAAARLKQLRQSGRKKKVTKDEVDKIAAAIILENWMQSNAYR
ncbi:Holliday junction resolvase RuvX [uncultured Cocleimonas sp.]|uniref:Holliday junction resolvase RuvX n=1 Tax=uncultured Cocleimonas sp. TaxID=1051587 RepID=UPI0026051657|nr:Holliday junction resolvase RuvX [uncultured Cocleimonas sp.]